MYLRPVFAIKQHTKNKTMKELNLTELQTQVLQKLIDNLYAEPNFTDVTVEDLSQYTQISIKKVRGVVSSLVNKGIIYIENTLDNEEKQSFVGLKGSFWYLHPDKEWQDDYKTFYS